MHIFKKIIKFIISIPLYVLETCFGIIFELCIMVPILFIARLTGKIQDD